MGLRAAINEGWPAKEVGGLVLWWEGYRLGESVDAVRVPGTLHDHHDSVDGDAAALCARLGDRDDLNEGSQELR
jgi:hypothetical protein